MRSFRDPGNVEWTVFEVRRQSRDSEVPRAPGYNDAWLCFENATSKRRLLKFPDRWREFTDTELSRLLQEATPAPRPSWSINDGIEGGSAAPGA